jgi:Tfp pilus assembly PilM family ATPase/Tfp pilus assembly protein PilN
MTTLLDKIFGTYLGIEFKEDSIVFTYMKNSFSGITLLSSSTFPLTYGETPSSEVQGYISQHSMSIHKVFVTLPDRWAITKFIDVPSMKGKGKGALANLMKFEIERHIPFEIDNVAYDFMVMDDMDMRSSVVVVAVQKEKVDFVKDYLEKLSVQPHAITVSSFAALNSIEMGGVSAGGWQDIIGIVRKSDVLGKKGEVNISMYVDTTNTSVAVIKDGLCINLRTFAFDVSQTPETFIIDLSRHIAELQASLALEQYNKLLLAEDTSSDTGLREELENKVAEGVVHVEKVEKFSGNLKGVEMNGLFPSVGACFGGLGIGTYRTNLLPHKTDYEIRKIAPLAAKVFLVLIILLLVGIISTEAVKEKKYLDIMEETLKQNEPEVKALEKLLSDINSIKEKSMLLYNVKNNEITLEILAELAAIMPKDSWITNLHYKGIDRNDKKKTASELIVNGYAASSSTLIPLLEDSPFFEKVEFVGPIKKTKDKEQFKLSARIVRPANQESETK